MGSVYKARREAALKQARRIQGYIDCGYLVMDGDVRVHQIKITSEYIIEKWNDTESGKFWFRNDLDLDADLYTKVKDIKSNFRRLQISKPVYR